MKPIKVTTIEQARALPEPDMHRTTIDPSTGITTVERIVPRFCPTPVEGDQILFFIDVDGRSMEIFYTPDGPAKRVSFL